jgi:hypothetical protein
MTAFHAERKDPCRLQNIVDWLNPFIYMHNKEITEKRVYS